MIERLFFGSKVRISEQKTSKYAFDERIEPKINSTLYLWGV